MVTHQLQVRCRPGKVCWSETGVLPLSHTTNFLITKLTGSKLPVPTIQSQLLYLSAYSEFPLLQLLINFNYLIILCLYTFGRVQSASVSACLCKSDCWSWPKYQDLPRESGSVVWTRSCRNRSRRHWETSPCTKLTAGNWPGAVWRVSR